MRVIVVAHAVSKSGGQERVAFELVRHLVAAGHEVVVVAAGCSRELASAREVRLVRIPAPDRPASLTYPTFYVFASAVLWRIRRREDAVVLNGPIVSNQASVMIAHFCQAAFQEVMPEGRNAGAGTLRRVNERIYSRLERGGERRAYTLQRIAFLLAVSDGVAIDLLRRWPSIQDRLVVGPNGVDCDEFRPDAWVRQHIRSELGLSGDAKVAIFVGGDWGRKRLQFVIDAVAMTSGWHLVVAGEGRPVEQGLAVPAHMIERVHLLGKRDDVPALLAAADVYTAASKYEAFSLALLEAAASALPLVVTRTSGTDYLVDEGSGIYVQTEAEMAAALEHLECDTRRLPLGQNARARAMGYSWGRQSALIEALLRKGVAN